MHAPRSRLVRLAAAMSVATIVLVACDDADPVRAAGRVRGRLLHPADGVESRAAFRRSGLLGRRGARPHAARRSASPGSASRDPGRRGLPGAHLQLPRLLPRRRRRVLRRRADRPGCGRTWRRPPSSSARRGRPGSVIGASMGGTAALVAASRAGDLPARLRRAPLGADAIEGAPVTPEHSRRRRRQALRRRHGDASRPRPRSSSTT